MQSGANLAEQPENHDDDIGSHARDEMENMQLSDDENMFITRHSVVFPEEQQQKVIVEPTIVCLMCRTYLLPCAEL